MITCCDQLWQDCSRGDNRISAKGLQMVARLNTYRTPSDHIGIQLCMSNIYIYDKVVMLPPVEYFESCLKYKPWSNLAAVSGANRVLSSALCIGSCLEFFI